MRVDVMSVMRGVAPFPELWERRVSLQDELLGTEYQLMALSDLVAAKKTQRSKDWPMIQRLLEADYLQGGTEPRQDPVLVSRVKNIGVFDPAREGRTFTCRGNGTGQTPPGPRNYGRKRTVAHLVD